MAGDFHALDRERRACDCVMLTVPLPGLDAGHVCWALGSRWGCWGVRGAASFRVEPLSEVAAL
jgi:hypothetical protein